MLLKARGLSLSLFGRLIAQGVRPYFLDVQFRSHPKLAEFSSEMIYGGRLRSGVTPQACTCTCPCTAMHMHMHGTHTAMHTHGHSLHQAGADRH